jgi:nucleoid-associated protein YgaU
MQRTDLVTPFALGPSLTSRRSKAFVRLSAPAILFASGAILFAAQCRAQSQSQTTDQDVAEAARQERARKDAQQKKSPHVYTEEDLKRAQILTPEDNAQVVARKNQQPTQPAEKSDQPSQQAVDAESLPTDAPLGDVARHYRQQKQSQKLQQSVDFHLPFADAPVLASPKPTVLTSPEQPVLSSPKPPAFVSPKPRVFNLPKPLLQPPLQNTYKPLAPRFAPYRPPLKRSPFERPKFLAPEPTMASPTRPSVELKRVVPSRSATVPKLSAPTRPLAGPTSPAKRPIAPRSSTQRNVITVKRGDSLWKLAKQNLGSGLRWHELLSANPGILDPNRILAGSQIVLPLANSYSATNRGSHASRSRPLSSPRVSSRPQALADSDLLGKGLHFLPLVAPDP